MHHDLYTPTRLMDWLLVLLFALIAHFIFNRWEPTNLPVVFTLLILVPGALSGFLIAHFGALLGVLAAFTAYYAALCPSIVAYRLSPFHPMARYPGPMLAKVSKLYVVYLVRKGSPWVWIRRQHQKYGQVVRIGPNEIIIADVNAILPMLGSQGLPKGPSWEGRAMHRPIPSLIACRDLVEHARRRRPWNRAFSTAATKEYEPLLKKRAAQLVKILSRHDDIVDLAQYIEYFSYDFMGDMAFGGGTELLAKGDPDGIVRRLSDGIGISLVYDQMPWISHYTKMIPAIGRKHKTFHSMIMETTAARYKSGSTSKDLFYYLSNEDGAEKESPSRGVVLSDGSLAFVAGSETTSGTLSTIFRCLLQDPATYKRLQAEVDKYYPPDEDSLSTKHHQEMPYLDAVINETLRLYPVLPNGTQRAPKRGEGDRVVGPYFLPQGNQARINFYTMQRDPRYFSHPDKFWPDRWLIAEGLQHFPEEIAHEPRAFIPFSFGPSNCVGKFLAMQNMRTVLCHIMQKLEISLPEGRDVDQESAYHTKTLPVVVCRRG